MKDILALNPEAHFTKDLPGDPILENFIRQVPHACFSYVATKKPANPKKVHVSNAFLEELDLSIEDQQEWLEIASGAKPFNDFEAYAMCYGGHQFGHWAGQLGDGRAINIGDVNLNGQLFQFQLKGSGPTPYSRTADGLAVLRSSIREYLCSEAMHYLGVPSTRALSLVKTGDDVPRDMLYNGNQKDEPGAVVCRVAPSFVRFGSFEIFASRKDKVALKLLVDYIIKHHYPELGEPKKETYIAFFREVMERTKTMILHWQRVGFVHGVMNTDNLSILGLTIDYGPYGWLEDYNPDWTPNTTDAQHRRYRFGNQSHIALWNLAQLANTLYPLIEEVAPLQSVIDDFKSSYGLDYHIMMLAKLGLHNTEEVPIGFVADLTSLMTKTESDMTLFFRRLSAEECTSFDGFRKMLVETSYLIENEVLKQEPGWIIWYQSYSSFIDSEGVSFEKRAAAMNEVNPKYVLRNYMAQMAIELSEKGDESLVDELYQLLLKPYEEQPQYEKWFAKRPEWARNKVGCSMLSCSS